MSIPRKVLATGTVRFNKDMTEAQIESAPSESGWIKTSDRLPSNTDTVLFFAHRIYKGHYAAESWWDDEEQSGYPPVHDQVTHWMPLPEKP